MDVFEYQDYRELLDDYIKERSSQSSQFSIRGMTLKAGIKSPGFYREIIQGKRNFTLQTLSKTLLVLNWTPLEKQFFEALVWYQQADTPQLKDQYFKQIFKLKQSEIVNTLDPAQFGFYSHWIHSVVRELIVKVKLPDDIDSTSELTYLCNFIQSKLLVQVEVSLIAKSISLLIEQNIIYQKGSQYYQNQETLSAPQQYSSHQIKYFQGLMLQKALEILPHDIHHPKMNSSTTLNLSDQQFEHTKDLLRQLRKDLMTLEEDSQPKSVFQLNMNLFALSKKVM